MGDEMAESWKQSHACGSGSKLGQYSTILPPGNYRARALSGFVDFEKNKKYKNKKHISGQI